MELKRKAWLYPVIGVVLLLLGLWVLGANEHVAAVWHEGLARHGGGVTVVSSDAKPNPHLQGRRVLLTGVPTVVKPPRDPIFRVTADTSVLVRQVSMFQWHEVGYGNHVTYAMDWVGHPVDSSRFPDPRHHTNPGKFPFGDAHFPAEVVRLGPYRLVPVIAHALPGALQQTKPDVQDLPSNLQATFLVYDGQMTTSADPKYPRIGDLRVRWLVKPLQTVTVLATVDGDELVPGSRSGAGFQVQLGKRSLVDLFPDLPLPPQGVWAWRVLAVVLAWLGVWLILARLLALRLSVPLALAGGVMLLAVLASIVWIPASIGVALISWTVAVLAAAGACLCWWRLVGLPPTRGGG